MKLTKKLVLGSKSPRRAQLLTELGFDFTILTTDADENAPGNLGAAETAIWISEQKAQALQPHLSEEHLGITSDTEVWFQGKRYGKPSNDQEAIAMLQSLSGQVHQVVSGLTLVEKHSMKSFVSEVEVEFATIPQWAIEHYVHTYKPLDKAGAYGIQEWIGMGFITRISGEYNSVVGLPTATLFQALTAYKK